MEPAERILSRCRKEETHILWTGPVTPYGYPRAHIEGKVRDVTRWFYTHSVQDVPDGQMLRRCTERACINPDHQTLVPRSEAIGRKSTHCKRGHEFSPENTRISQSGKKTCRECDKQRARKRREEAQ